MKKNSEPRTGKRDWDRSQVTVRLGAARKAQLRELAARESIAGGPGNALQRALEIAISRGPAALSVEDLSDLSAEIAAARESSESRLLVLEQRLENLLAAVDALARAIASAVAEEC